LGFDNNGENGLNPGAGFKPAPAFMELTGAAKMARRRLIAANPMGCTGIRGKSIKGLSQNQGLLQEPVMVLSLRL
jgi:hypothetical protein